MKNIYMYVQDTEELGLYSETTVEAWFNYFSTGDSQYYGEMINSLEKDALES